MADPRKPLCSWFPFEEGIRIRGNLGGTEKLPEGGDVTVGTQRKQWWDVSMLMDEEEWAGASRVAGV